MSLLLLFNQRRASGPTVASGDLAFSGSGDASFSGASIASAAASADGIGAASLSGAAVGAAAALMAGAATVDLTSASIAASALAADGAGDLAAVGEGEGAGTVEAGAFSFSGAGDLVVVGEAVEESVYRPAWIGAVRQLKRRRRRALLDERARLIEADDEDVLALVMAAVAAIDRQDSKLAAQA